MARSWWRIHGRQLAMQGLLCLVLAATLALAALAVREKRRELRVRLDAPQELGHLRVSLPYGWVVRSDNARAHEGGEMVVVDEPAAHGETGRRLTVARQRCTGLVGPVEQIVRSQMLSGIASADDLQIEVGRGRAQVDPIDVAGFPGRLVRWEGAASGREEWVACAVAGATTAIIIKLEGPGAVEAADNELMRQMAERQTVQVADLPALSAADGELELADGICLQVPRHFDVLACDDPNTTARRLLCDSSGDAWAAVDLVPCVLLPGADAADIKTLLLAYDRGWPVGSLTPAGPHAWRIGASDESPRRLAYLTTDGKGQALLAVFRGDLGDAAPDFDGLWAKVAPTVRFTGQRDMHLLLANGSAVARRASSEGLGRALGPRGQQVWWLGDRKENVDKGLWMRLEWTCSGEGPDANWSGSRRTAFFDWSGADAGTDQEWSGGGDLKLYSTRGTSVAEHGGAGSDPLGSETLRQQLTVEGGRQVAIVPGPVTGRSGVVPDQYVPGGWLPFLLGEFSRADADAGPMILRTESFVGYDALPLPSWLLLSVWRDERGPVMTDGNGRPLDCLSVSVSGSGAISRWYFSDGVLRFIDLGDGRRARTGADVSGP